MGHGLWYVLFEKHAFFANSLGESQGGRWKIRDFSAISARDCCWLCCVICVFVKVLCGLHVVVLCVLCGVVVALCVIKVLCC